MTDFLAQTLEGLAAMGISVDEATASALVRHLELVLEANERMNLTSIEPDDAVPLHILDSCAALGALDDAPGGAFADVGSGAGYPGIPLAILSGRPVDLIESVRKKAAFLDGVVRDLRLNATVHPIRAEELALSRGGAYAAVTARAVAALPSLVELAAPLLALGGCFICLKARPTTEELSAGDAAAALCGMTPGRLKPVLVPFVDGARVLVIYEKASQPRVKLPRRTGLAQRDPLK